MERLQDGCRGKIRTRSGKFAENLGPFQFFSFKFLFRVSEKTMGPGGITLSTALSAGVICGKTQGNRVDKTAMAIGELNLT